MTEYSVIFPKKKKSNLIWTMFYCWLIIPIAFRRHTHFEELLKMILKQKLSWLGISVKMTEYSVTLSMLTEGLPKHFFHSWYGQISFDYFLVNIVSRRTKEITYKPRVFFEHFLPLVNGGKKLNSNWVSKTQFIITTFKKWIKLNFLCFYQ